MPDPVTLAVTAYALAGRAYETGKKLWDLREKIKDVEIQNLIADLRNDLADLKVNAADLKIEIATLKEEKLALQTDLKKNEEKAAKVDPPTVFKDGAIFFLVAPPGRPNGPYCPNCKQNSDKWVLMRDNRGTQWEFIHKFECPACNSSF